MATSRCTKAFGNVHGMAYHKDAIVQAGSYPNLNNNVYCESLLSPIRD